MHEVLDDYVGRSALPTPLSLPHTLWRNLCLVWQYTFGQISRHSKVDPEASTAAVIGPNDSRRVESFQEKHTERYLEKRDHAKKTEGIVESSLIKLGRAQHDNMVVLNSKMDRLESHVDDVLERHVRRLEDRV